MRKRGKGGRVRAEEPEVEPADVGEAPASREALGAWVRSWLGVEVASRAMVEGHAAPLDYLWWAYSEGAGEESAGPADAVVWANRGGGKTFLGAIATLLDMVFKPGVEVRILGGSLEQSRRMHAHLRRFLSPRLRPALAELVSGRITEKRIALSNGSEVEILAQSQASVRGTRVHKLRCDEVELFDPEVWEAAQLVTRSGTLRRADGSAVAVRGSVECLSTMHRPHGVMHAIVGEARAGRRRLFRWGVADVLERCGEEHACRREEGGVESACALWGECRGRAKESSRVGHVRVSDALLMKGRVSLATWEAEMLCLRPRKSDAVLPEFDVREHVREAVREGGGAWVAGMDFGFRAPTVVLWGWADDRGVLWIVDERVESGRVLDEHVAALLAGRARDGGKEWGRPAWVGVDPAGRAVSDQTGVSAVQAMRRAGLVVRDRRLTVEEGLGLVRARLKPASGAVRLFVSPRCEKLIESLERYHYNPADKADERPVKDGPDHAVDALRYLVQNLDRPVRAAGGVYL